MVCENREEKPQVPPLRSFGAPVGMTILLCPQESFSERYLTTTIELSSRPELRRSVVEGPAVSSSDKEAPAFAGASLLLNAYRS